MDKQARGLLLVEREEAEANVKQITERLKKISQKLIALANSLNSSPQNVVFSNAPGDLSVVPHDFRGAYSSAWEDIPDKEEIARLTQQLRKEQARLAEIRKQLQSKQP